MKMLLDITLELLGLAVLVGLLAAIVYLSPDQVSAEAEYTSSQMGVAQ